MAEGRGSGWERLGGVAPGALADARGQVHHAAQIVATVGKALIKAEPDFSHTSLEWVIKRRVLATRPAGGGLFRAALAPADLTLYLLGGPAGVYGSFALDGKTMDEGLTWLSRSVTTAGGDGTALRKEFTFEIPTHPVADGAPFAKGDGAALAELTRWYANAGAVLRRVARKTPGASPVRCWPHHLDIATLVTIDGQGESARTVGLGMQPGDAGYPEPYFYVTPWPYPKDPQLPPLEGGGQWHTEGWTGAVLTGPALVAAGDAQAESLEAFLVSAYTGCRALLG